MTDNLQPTDQFNRIVTISNQAAEYPPLDLSKMQYQALLILVSCIDSTQKPVYGIDDIVEEIRQRGIVDSQEQMLFLEEVIMRQNTYRIPYKEYLRYFTGGDAPQGSVIQRAMDAVLSLNNKSFKFNNPDFEGSFVWFQAVALDKKTNDLVFVITSFAKPFLLGLRRDFLQMLAESTIEFDGKYSVPIFLYLKSRLFDGRQEFHSSESLEVFKRRFGLDTIKTYDRFFDFQRRILDVAEADSLKSGDIRFVFTGVPEPGSKRISELQYSIYRIGNIKPIRNKKALPSAEQTTEKPLYMPTEPESSSQSHRQKVTALSDTQRRAYEFLAAQGINRGFIVDKILVHPNFKLEILRGGELEYVETIWQYFLKKTKSLEKAGAFVLWWKNGRLTRTEVHWQAVEMITRKRKAAEKRATTPTIFTQNVDKKQATPANETPSKTVDYATYKKMTRLENSPNSLNISRIGQKVTFDYAAFQRDYPSVFQQITAERTAAFATFLALPNYRQLLESSVIAHSESWWKQSLKHL